MNIRFKIISAILSLFLLPCCSLALAVETGGVTVGGTRLIYDGGKKEASLSVTNSDSNPYLIQSWAEMPNDGGDKAPFIVTPPLFRLDAGQQNLLRVVRKAGRLPEDRESLYWLNVKSIPAINPKKDTDNTLQIAVKTRIKLIYRPSALKGVPEDVTDKLTWSQSGNKLTVNNPTPFVMNFQQVKVGRDEVKNVSFVGPMSSATFTTPTAASGAVSWRIITDFGGVGSEHTSAR